MLSLSHWRWETVGDRERRRAVADRARALTATRKSDRHLAGMVGIDIIEHLHDGDAEAADKRAVEMAELGISLGEPHVEWVGKNARFSWPFLRGDLRAAAARSDEALARGLETGVTGAATAHATQQFCLAWVTGGLSAFATSTEAFDGPRFVWDAALALAKAISGDYDGARRTSDGILDEVALGATDWLHFVGVALAVEAATVLGVTEILSASRPVMQRRSEDHVVLGMGVTDLGPVSRYIALIESGLGNLEQATTLLRGVRDDPRSGHLWQVRAARDLSFVTGSSPSTDSRLWAWSAHHPQTM
jgi:hypothetical protein